MAFPFYSCLLLGWFVIDHINTISTGNYLIVLIFNILIFNIIKFILYKFNLYNFKTALVNYIYVIKNQLIKFISNFIKKILLNSLFIINLFIDIFKFIYNLPILLQINIIILLMRLIYLILIFYIPYLTHIIIFDILPDINYIIADLPPFVLKCFNYYNLNEQFVELSNNFDYNISYNTYIIYDIKELNFNINFNFLIDLFNDLYKLFNLDIKYNDLFNNVYLLNFKNYFLIIIDNFYQTLYLLKNLFLNIENLNLIYNIKFNNLNSSIDNNNNNILESINNSMDNNNSDDNKLIKWNSNNNKWNSDDNNNSDDNKSIKSNSDENKLIKSKSKKNLNNYNKIIKSNNNVFKKISVIGDKLKIFNYKTKKLSTYHYQDNKLTKISEIKIINKNIGINSKSSNYDKTVDLNKLLKLVNINISKLDEDTGSSVGRGYRGRFLINPRSMSTLCISNLYKQDENPERFSLLNDFNRIRPTYNSLQNPLKNLTPTYDNNNDDNSDTYSKESQLNYYRNMLVQNNLEDLLLPNITRSEIINEINNEILNHLTEIESNTTISNVNDTTISNVNDTSISNVNDTSISNVNIIPISNNNETTISNNNETIISNDTTLANTNDITMNNVNETPLANTITNSNYSDNIDRGEGPSNLALYNYSDNIDRGEGPSNLALTSTNNTTNIPNLAENIPNTNLDAFYAANYELFFGNEDFTMAEIFQISGGANSNYLGGVDFYGNMHLNADILNDPAFNHVANLVPGVDFVEGYDSFAVYDHDSEFFKTMIQNAYNNNNHERLLDYFDSSKKTWYNSENRILAREYLWELISKKYNINLDEIENQDSEMKELESNDKNNKTNDKGKGKAI